MQGHQELVQIFHSRELIDLHHSLLNCQGKETASEMKKGAVYASYLPMTIMLYLDECVLQSDWPLG